MFKTLPHSVKAWLEFGNQRDLRKLRRRTAGSCIGTECSTFNRITSPCSSMYLLIQQAYFVNSALGLLIGSTGEQKVFTLEFWGPYNIGEHSKVVAGAFDSEWGHWRWWIAPQSLQFLETVLKKDPRTASFNWQIGVPQDVSEHGAIDVLPIKEERQEYDITALTEDGSRLFFGERGFHPPARPEQRPAKLSTDGFIRSSVPYAKHREATIHWDSSLLRTVAVVGMGEVGVALGRMFVRHGHKVLFGSREPHSEKSKAVVASAPGTTVIPVQDAIDASSVVVLALPGHVVVDTARELNLQDKLVIDVTNPIGEGLLLTIGTTTSAGEEVAAVAKGAHVIKCFNTIGCNHFEVSSPLALCFLSYPLRIVSDDVTRRQKGHVRLWRSQGEQRLGVKVSSSSGLRTCGLGPAFQVKVYRTALDCLDWVGVRSFLGKRARVQTLAQSSSHRGTLIDFVSNKRTVALAASFPTSWK